MDLLVEKGNSKTYLSQLGFLVTSFEEGAPTIARNSTNIQGRSGSVDFGGWHESKKVKLEGFYRAEDQYEEETLKERLFALLSDPEGIYITEMRGEIGQGFERPGETEGEAYEHMMTRPSHKRFYVYASSIENELQGNVGGTVLYKMSVEFTTLKLPYGESVPRDLDVKLNVPYYGRNLLKNTGNLSSTSTTTSWATLFNSSQIYDSGIKSISGVSAMVFSFNVYVPLDAVVGSTIPIQFKGQNSQATNTGGDEWNTLVGKNNYAIKQDDLGKTIRASISIQKYSNYQSFDTALADTASIVIRQNSNIPGYVYSKLKLETGSKVTPWSPAPKDPEYNAWYTKIYYNTDNLVIPYAGTVLCNQLEQGFTVEFTAKESGSNFKLNVNGTELTYNGQVYNGDVLKLSGYEYTKNGLSVVRATNKAYFKLLPNVTNTLSSNLHGTIKVLNFQNLYA